MVFSNEILDWGHDILKHNLFSNKRNVSGTIIRLQRKNIDDKSINKLIEDFKLTFCNHFIETSHLVSFIESSGIGKKQRDAFFYYLFIFIKQYYSNFDFLKDINDVNSLITIFNTSHDLLHGLLDKFLRSQSLELANNNIRLLNKIFKFYDIIEEFMIRYYSYSIVGISNQKYVITACSDCNKRFIDYLMDGYSLFRLQKIGLKNNNDNNSSPMFEFFPVLPTKDVGFSFDEYIEIGNENNIESKRLIKLL